MSGSLHYLDAMTLSSAYIDYLNDRRSRRRRSALADALDAADFQLESWLLRAMDQGLPSMTIARGNGEIWDGRRVWFGELLPADPAVGDIWFDPVEVVPMILLADVSWNGGLPELDGNPTGEDAEPLQPTAWISLRSVAEWQYRAFLDLGQLLLRPSQTLPFPPFDAERLLRHGERKRVTGLTSYEALSFAEWLGKTVAVAFMFAAAFEQLTSQERDVFWYGRLPEWANWFDEEEAAIIAKAPFPLDDDYAEWEEYFDGGYVATVDNWTTFPDVGFRSAIMVREGLLRGRDVMPYMPSLGKLVERIPRAER
jgi:hypothetical protein